MSIALITGANRGIGLEFVRQLKNKGFYTIGTCRTPEQATELNKLADEVIPLDVTSDTSILDLEQRLNGRPIDLLINNAGINGEKVRPGQVRRHNFLEVLDTNCVSVIKLIDSLLPNITASKEKGILVLSSRMGSIADNTNGGSYAYRASKAALNCALRSYAIDVADKGVKIMLIHPGWVQTDMGGEGALIDAETSVTGMLNEIQNHLANSQAEVLRRFDGGTIAW